MAVGKLIKALRVQNQMTQAQLAKKADVSINTVRLYEGDKVGPKVATLQKIADALDVTLDYLLGRTRDPHTRLATQEDIDRFFGVDSFTTKDGVGMLSRPDGALMHYFSLLNDEGKTVAVDRVKELTEIPRYTREKE